jgi:hypothetical protein
MDDWELPRLSARLSDAEMIVLLATQRRADGKHRYSANQIQTLIGGDRNTVLARVKELRYNAPPIVYRPLAPEQQQLRDPLRLDRERASQLAALSLRKTAQKATDIP